MNDDDIPNFIYAPTGDFLLCDLCNCQLTEKNLKHDIAKQNCYWLSYGLVCEQCYFNVFKHAIEHKRDPDHDRVKLFKRFDSGVDVSEVRENFTVSFQNRCSRCNTFSIQEIGNSKDIAGEMVKIVCPSCGYQTDVKVRG